MPAQAASAYQLVLEMTDFHVGAQQHGTISGRPGNWHTAAWTIEENDDGVDLTLVD